MIGGKAHRVASLDLSFSLDRALGLQLGEDLRRAGIPFCSFPSPRQGQSHVYLCMHCVP